MLKEWEADIRTGFRPLRGIMDDEKFAGVH